VIPKGTQGKHDGHYAHILALAVSTDGKFLVSGGRDRSLYVWDAGNLRLLKELKHHRDAISVC
jgi:ribosomal RNA-processing protein 9